MPLRTTLENYEAHRKGILCSDLPKTFQDTVELAQGIDIKYIWIDSVCIIQDHSQDWHSEAAKMRDVYSNATLVVAASGAKDSREGLFIDERPRSSFFRLPYRQAGEIKGTFNMMRTPNWHKGHPSDGPLEGRAWTLQERLLARRVVAFMPNCISWVCEGVQMNETGLRLHSLGIPYEWCDVLAEYTRRSLTFASDRLEAIRVIVDLYQESSEPGLITDRSESYQTQLPNGYIFEYGVWKRDLAFQLLWFKDGPCVESSRLAHIPSWSWAATGFAKMWPKGYHNPKHNNMVKVMPQRLVLTSAGHLEILRPLSTARLPSIERYTRRKVDGLDDRLLWMLEGYGHDSRDSGFGYFCLDGSHGQTMLGLARFDDDTTTECTLVWFVVKLPENLYLGDEPFVMNPCTSIA